MAIRLSATVGRRVTVSLLLGLIAWAGACSLETRGVGPEETDAGRRDATVTTDSASDAVVDAPSEAAAGDGGGNDGGFDAADAADSSDAADGALVTDGAPGDASADAKDAAEGG